MRDAPGPSFSVLRTSQAAFAAIAISVALTAPPALAQGRAPGEGCGECYAYLEYPPSERTSDPWLMLPFSAHETDPSTTWPTDTSSQIKH